MDDLTPDFLVVGAPKSATTSICGALASHRNIGFSIPKEVGYFTDDRNYALGWNWYLKHFPSRQPNMLLGEGTVQLSMSAKYPKAVERLSEDLPRAKLIYVVRHPIKRTLSHWRMVLRDNDPGSSIVEALTSGNEYDRLVDPSKYWKQVSRLRSHFPDNRIKLVFFEDFIEQPDEVFRDILAFLGLPQEPAILNLTVPRNSGRRKPWATKSSRWIRKIPGFHRAKENSPRLVGLMNSLLLSKVEDPRIEQRSKLDRPTFEWLVNELEPDARQFLRFTNRPQDFWNFSGTEYEFWG